jgi:hypothetical protein
MATREEIISGLELMVAQAKRTTSFFGEGEWDAKRPAGWTPKEIYSHLSAVAAMVPQLAQGLTAAPEERDISSGMDIGQLNAASVNAMASMAPEQVMQAFEQNYSKLIEFIKAMPEEQLNMKRTFLGLTLPVSDIMANTLMLHGLHHVYEAYAPVAG